VGLRTTLRLVVRIKRVFFGCHFAHTNSFPTVPIRPNFYPIATFSLRISFSHTPFHKGAEMKKTTLLAPVIAAATLMIGCNDYLCLAPAGTTANSKLTICHVTGKKGKFELVTVKASAAQAHVDHGDFLAPAGATKASQCVEPVVVPPVVDTVVVVPPVVVPPVVVPPVVVPPVVIPPVVVDPTPTPTPEVTPPTTTPGTSGNGGSTVEVGEEEEEPTTPPANGGSGGSTTIDIGELPGVNCLLNLTAPECQM
jgi:hypothetical protein